MTGPEHLERPGWDRRAGKQWTSGDTSLHPLWPLGTLQVAWGGPSGALPVLECVVYRSVENKAFSSPLGPVF